MRRSSRRLISWYWIILTLQVLTDLSITCLLVAIQLLLSHESAARTLIVKAEELLNLRTNASFKCWVRSWFRNMRIISNNKKEKSRHTFVSQVRMSLRILIVNSCLNLMHPRETMFKGLSNLWVQLRPALTLKVTWAEKAAEKYGQGYNLRNHRRRKLIIKT